MRWEDSRPVVQQTIRNKGGNSPGRMSTEARGFKNSPYSENKTFLDLALTLWPFPRKSSSGVDNFPRRRNARLGSGLSRSFESP